MKLLLKERGVFTVFLMLSLLLLSTFALAAPGIPNNPGGAPTLGSLATNVTLSFHAIGRLMIAAAYIGGFGLTVAAIFKFKQHKDNPTQIPIGTPIALLVIGIILVFLPGLFGTAGQTVFGDEKTIGGFLGEGVDTVTGRPGGGNPGIPNANTGGMSNQVMP